MKRTFICGCRKISDFSKTENMVLSAISRLVRWFENPKNALLVKAYFKGKLPTKKDFPQGCPYTFEQIMEYKPWIREFMERGPKEQEGDKPKDKQIG
jgi:hypothetical protein